MKPVTLKGVLKFLSFVLIFILSCEVIFLIYQKYEKDHRQVYYDITNDMVVLDDGYLSFGSSDFHDSKKYDYTGGFEKAKMVRYDKHRTMSMELQYERAKASTFYSGLFLDDGILAVGSGAFSDDQIKNDTRDALIVKYDFDGNIVWEKQFQELGDSKFVQALVIHDQYYVIGQSIFPPTEIGFRDTGGGVIARYSSSGELLGKSFFGGEKSGMFSSFVLVDDFLYVVGKDAMKTGLLVKYDLNLERQFVKNYNYTDQIGFSSIVSNGEMLYVVGSTKVSDDENDFDTDAILLGYDFDGNIRFAVTYQGDGMERFNDLIIDRDHLVMVGHSAVLDKKASTDQLNVFRYHGLFFTYDMEGNLLSKQEFGGSMDDYMMGLVKDNQDYLVFGYSNSCDKDLKILKGNGKDFYSRRYLFRDDKLVKVW